MLITIRRPFATLFALAVAAGAISADVYGGDFPLFRFISSSASRHTKEQRLEAKHDLARPDDWRSGQHIHYPDQLENGYTLVLPGVLGNTPYNGKLVKLLQQSNTGVELYDWTSGVPLFKRRGLKDNHFSLTNINNITRRIIDYQQRYPDRPVYVFALCAGAGVACESLAQLPEAHQIDTAVLLGPALSPNYDLRPALRGTQNGIDSYHSPLDVPVLMALTTVTGTVDGRHMPAAGAVGFGLGFERSQNLRQHMYNPKMLTQGHLGGHFGWTATKFFEVNLLPIMKRD